MKMTNSTYLVFYDNTNDPEFFVFSSLKNAKRYVKRRFLDDLTVMWEPVEHNAVKNVWQWEDGGSEYVSIRKLGTDEALTNLTVTCKWCEGDGIVGNHKGQCLSDCKKCKGTGKLTRRS